MVINTLAKGNGWRRKVALWFEAAGWATITRGIGFPGDDILAVRHAHVVRDVGYDKRVLGQVLGPRLSIEAKNHRRIDLATFVDQADRQADADAVPVTVIHRPGKAAVDDAYFVLSGRSFRRLLDGEPKVIRSGRCPCGLWACWHE